MSGQGRLVGGILIGLGLAYLLDPDRGARRRALVRDKATSTGHKVADGVGAAAADLRNRVGGTAAEVRSRIRGEQVSDEILHERVRSALGRAVSSPGAIVVTAHEAKVTLQGPVLEGELDGLLRAVRRVRGVSEVVNELEVHPTADNVPALRGGEASNR
jgi:osmotically-inducible protein OsmY